MMQIKYAGSLKKCIWEFRFVAESEAKDKALQHGKGAISDFENFIEAGTCPFEGDSADAIRMFECSTQAPKGTASDSSIHAVVVDENGKRT